MSLTFPIYFLSYDEPNANENWRLLSSRFPQATRVHGVSGIWNAHRICAQSCNQSHFFVVDGDNQILPDFHFTISEEIFDPNAIHVWRCRNPINGLVYGYGAVKLFPKRPFQQLKEGIDLSTGLGVPYKIIQIVASETHFHSSPFHAWRSAFRECAKLASEQMKNQISQESSARLDAWCTTATEGSLGEWCLRGAAAGKNYAIENKNSPENLKKINDFDWLKTIFIEKFPLDEFTKKV